MARAIWKGSISFGLVSIPVGLFTAEERDELSFKQLDRRNLSPVGYKKYNKATGEDVATDQIVKGYEYDDGRYVVMTEEDFAKANPEATQTVEITDFVEASEIDPMYFDKPYYLAPIGKSTKGYALLRETLKRSGKVGIAKVVIRSRQYLAAVIPRGPVLVLEILRYPDEIRGMDDLELPPEDVAEVGVSPKELAMAEQLVEGMAEPWDPARYRDEYRDDLLALIHAKAGTGTVAAPTAAAPAERGDVIDIMTLLKRSVAEAGKAKPKPAGRSQKAAAPKSTEEPKKPRARQRRSA
jgi:DNA end-binding protein Ku